MAEPQNDWIIEDSEEEDQLCAPERDPAPQGVHHFIIGLVPDVVFPMCAAEDAVSSIQSFTPTVIKSVHETSHISSLDCAPPAQHIAPPFPPQAEHSTISEYSIKSDPKPRPRPIFSHPNTNPTANTSTSDPILPYTPASDREQPTIVAHSDPTGIESISGNTTSAPIDFSQDIAERAKMRTRKAAKRLHLRSTQYPEDIIDITDDELAIAPTRKPKERPKPRPVKRPNRDHPPLPSDAVTVPVLSSSMSLPPSDPFPDSTVLDHTPPPPGLHEAAVSTSSPRQSPSRKGKRKRQGHLQSPIYHGPTDSNPFPSAPGRASSPQSDPPRPARMSDTMPDNHDAKGSDDEAGADESPKRPKNPKGTEGSSPGRSAIGKPKKKSIVEVVILSPKKKNKNKKTEASGDTSKLRKGSKSRNRRLVSSDEEDDELMLAPQSNSSTVAKSRNGKKTKLRLEDERPSTEVAASSSQIVMGKEQHEHRQGAAPISDIDGQDKAMSRSDERTTATPLKVDSNFSMYSYL